MRNIVVMRLGHRIPRDERITTHVALVARAFGARKMIYTGQKDEGLEESIKKVVKRWGGGFNVEYEKKPLKKIEEYKSKGYKIVHLTMYGIPLIEKKDEISKAANLLLIVGSEKVGKEVYEKAHYNISIGTQPHSEVAALALALELLNPSVFKRTFKGEVKIIPSNKGKIVEKTNP